jgi:hypothetical protein
MQACIRALVRKEAEEQTAIKHTIPTISKLDVGIAAPAGNNNRCKTPSAFRINPEIRHIFGSTYPESVDFF